VWYCVPTLLCCLLVLEWRGCLGLLRRGVVNACVLLWVRVCCLSLRWGFLCLGALLVFWARAKKRV
jgi:hypothetical protein